MRFRKVDKTLKPYARAKRRRVRHAGCTSMLNRTGLTGIRPAGLGPEGKNPATTEPDNPLPLRADMVESMLDRRRFACG